MYTEIGLSVQNDIVDERVRLRGSRRIKEVQHKKETTDKVCDSLRSVSKSLFISSKSRHSSKNCAKCARILATCSRLIPYRSAAISSTGRAPSGTTR